MAKSFKSLFSFDCFFVSKKKKKKKIFPGKLSKNIIVGVKSINVDPAMEIHFPEEIIVDILIRLPVPSLLRFKCASKFWKTIISDQYFKVKHYNYAKNNKKILITGLSQIPEAGTHISYYCSSLSSSQPLQNLCCPSNHKPCNYIILCCCDGLALLCCRRGDHLLWNPSTNESVQLPNHEITSLFGSTYGLGYDSISDDYKILRVEHMVNGRGRPSKILALKSGSWRKIGNHPRGFRNKIIPCKNSLPFVRGAFHWLRKLSKNIIEEELVMKPSKSTS
ncbi:hypothetical protein MTR67_050775 [Solanum verrucosum]|uniref:F-box domain-containing protein n=1 Tax=Solanum verrucosum TaxID=315347 RepID=A0AAF0V3W4_SOLVR|nr:hypothetical protein MTR67_050775 [Solanum verrucosum]